MKRIMSPSTSCLQVNQQQTTVTARMFIRSIDRMTPIASFERRKIHSRPCSRHLISSHRLTISALALRTRYKREFLFCRQKIISQLFPITSNAALSRTGLRCRCRCLFGLFSILPPSTFRGSHERCILHLHSLYRISHSRPISIRSTEQMRKPELALYYLSNAMELDLEEKLDPIYLNRALIMPSSSLLVQSKSLSIATLLQI
jgi:hypothetical protein